MPHNVIVTKVILQGYKEDKSIIEDRIRDIQYQKNISPTFQDHKTQ